jgi:uncharacterized Ntn-hydrolase superfamily protein
MTFTIIARNGATGEMGVASQSHFFAVGSLVGQSVPGAGVVASQAFADPSYITRGLAAMSRGENPETALSRLVEADPARDIRQIGMIASAGGASSYTGARCVGPAGAHEQDDVICMGNMLAAEVWEPMYDAYRVTDGPLADRLLSALRAGQSAGGDVRGKQSAMLLVTRIEASDAPWNDVIVNLRVDDHPEPIEELARLLKLDAGYGSLGAALFSPAMVTSVDNSSHELARADAALTHAYSVLRPNLEPLVWRAVIRVKSGRPEEARLDAAAAIASHPPYTDFIHNLGAAGIITDAHVKILLGNPL